MVSRDFYTQYTEIFLEENSKLNLISKNDEKFLWEKHIYDSLAIGKVFEKYGKPGNLLDIGTGGGFPAIPVALAYPDIKVTAVDSIAKKIRAVQTIIKKLELKNLTAVCSRIENLSGQYDIVVSRAVSSLKNICEYALPKLKKGGYFAAYKSRKAPDEIKETYHILKKHNAQIIDIIEYSLPLAKSPVRNIVVIGQN